MSINKKMQAFSFNAPFLSGIDGPPVFSKPFPDSSEVYDWAFYYVAQGLSVIPLAERGKTPIRPWGEYQKRRPNMAEIRAWFPPGTKHNIGIITGMISGINVIDFDRLEAYEAAMDKDFTIAPLVKTAKGFHLFFRATQGATNFQKRKELENVDFRGDGGYVVAPPSIHPSGLQYQWVEGSDCLTLPKLPYWVLGSAQKKKSNRPQLLDGVSEGGRNNALASLAGAWFHDGKSLDDVLILAQGWNLKNDPPMENDEVNTTVRSIFKLHKAVQGSPLVSKETLPSPLPDELLPVAAFDYEMLPDSLRPWIKDICERIQCPPDFVAVGVITCLAAVIGRKVGIRPQARTDWTVIPNCWGMVIGRPGVLKSPALEAALAPLKRLTAEANKQYRAAMGEHGKAQIISKLKAEAAEKAARKKLADNPSADLLAVLAVDEVAIPTEKRFISNDPTPASLGALLIENPNGLLVHRDEVVSLLKNLDREDNAEGRGFYLTGWNGDSAYTIDRIGRGLNLYIEAVCISLLGGTQPGRAAEYIRQAIKGGAGDDGLIQRFGLLVWPDNGGTWKDVDRWPDNDAKNQAFRVFDYLNNLDPAAVAAQQDTGFDGNPEGVPYLRFSSEALGLFLEWRIDLENRLRGDDLHPALESHFSKYRKLIPALALILHLAEGGTGPVTRTATIRALAWSEYLESHAKRVYGAGTQPAVATAKLIVKKIRQGHLQSPFSSRDVWRPAWSGLSDREQVAEGLRLLVDYGWLQEERDETTGGRPATFYSNTEWPE